MVANDVHEWAEGFLTQLESAHAGEPGATARVSSKQEIAALVEAVRGASHLMCLFDYDGTLVPFATDPDAAAPDDELRDLLRALAAKPGARVHVLSGRKREDLERWIGQDWVHNWQSKMIAGEANGQKAIDLLCTRFGFVGLTERFDETLVLLGGWLVVGVGYWVLRGRHASRGMQSLRASAGPSLQAADSPFTPGYTDGHQST